jgi:hypothetical protein
MDNIAFYFDQYKEKFPTVDDALLYGGILVKGDCKETHEFFEWIITNDKNGTDPQEAIEQYDKRNLNLDENKRDY